ncbi:MAG TPA: TIR domain-containing protein [Steroidobacteraceae bacterium]|nr:TIR domain-containing protein [Steroidobacteraceae bacterium]
MSYASEDGPAAARICEGLRAAGIEVWFDRSDLHSGDAWDRKIRSQIGECGLFIPIISSNSQARLEGYFRREWRLAVERTHDMADGKHFLLPVVIDDTSDADAHVPDAFRAVHWTRLDAGRVTGEFAAHVAGLLEADVPEPVLKPRAVASTHSKAMGPGSAAAMDAREHARPGPRPKALATWLAGSAAVSALVLGAFLLSRHSVPVAPAANGDSAPTPSAAAERPRLAVLPFENLSPDPNNAFFTDGMHEEILTALANGVPGLDVISRTTMDTYKGKAVTAQTLARELHCSYVLEGSMRRDGNEARLALQLIDARSDRHVWAQDFDRKLVNIMALESEVAASVAAQISSKLQAGPATPVVATNPAAFDLYLKARAGEEDAGENTPVGDWQNVQGQLDEALRLDPDFTRAYVERISVRVSLFVFNHDPAGAGLTAAHGDLAAARKLAPQDPLVTSAEALLAYAEKDYARALQLFETAEAAGLVDSRMAEWKGRLLFAMGRYAEAAALNERLLRLDPKNRVPEAELWFALMEMHQPQAAMRVASQEPNAIAREQMQDTVREAFMGDQAAFKAVFEAQTRAPLDNSDEIDANLAPAVLDGLQYLERYREARDVIDRTKVADVRESSLDWPPHRIGRFPLADLRGWFDLLLGDAAEARRDARGIALFLKNSPETRWNKWVRTLLRADLQLFSGNRGEAIAIADQAVTLTRADADVSDQMDAVVWATQIRAWSGAQDEAVSRLETLSTSVPGLWPWEVIVDPIWAVPLAQNEHYRNLRARIEALTKTSRL